MGTRLAFKLLAFGASIARHGVVSAALLLCFLPRVNGQSPDQRLLDAAQRGDLAAATKALEAMAKVDARNELGRTSLLLAAHAGHFEVVKLLVEKGADPNARTPTETGSTVLEFAIEGKSLKTIDYLIIHGADVNLKGRDGSTPLCHAATRGETEIVELLLSKGADPNLRGLYDSNGNYIPPMMAAGYSAHLDTVKLLVSRGARIEKRTNKGHTALMELAKRPCVAVMKFLIEKGANVNARGSHGHTALIYAAYNGQTENIKLLLAAGADPLLTATDDPDPDKEYGRYGPEVVARQQGHSEALELILDAQSRARSSQGK